MSLIIITIGLFATWLINNPKEGLTLAQKYILPKDLDIKWDTFDLDIYRINGFTFDVKVDIENLLMTKEKPKIRAPIDKIDLDILIDPFATSQLAVNKLKIKSSQEIYFLSEKQNSPSKKSIYEQALSILNKIDMLKVESPENFSVEVSSLKIDSKNVPLLLSFTLNAKSKANIQIDSNINELGKASFKSIISAEIFLDHRKDQPLLDGNISFDSNELNAKSIFHLNVKDNKGGDKIVQAELDSNITYIYGKSKIIFNPKAKIFLNPKTLGIDIDSNALGIPGPLKEVKNISLKALVPLSEGKMWSSKETDVQVIAPLRVFFVDKKTRLSIKKVCKDCEIPQKLMAKVKGQIWLSNLFSDSNKKMEVIQAQMTLEQVTNRIFHLEMNANLEAFKENKKFLFSPNVNAAVDIYSFKEFLKLLKTEKILIPAPIDTLDGTVKVSLAGDAMKMKKSSIFPLNIVIDLSSENQKVKLKSDAEVILDKTFKKAGLNIFVDVQDLELVLPPLDPIKGIPRIVSDTRILKDPKKIKTKKGFQLNVDFSVRTAEAGAIKLKHKIFKPYIPITLNLTNKDDLAPDYIKTEPFDVVYLRRKMSVKKLKLDMSQLKKSVIPIEARFQVNQTEYTVFIDIKGTVENPNLILSSDPYLPENEIISVLLYNTTSKNLAEGDANTSASVQSAVANRAIGLFGLWVFASTPIKRFYYNPATNVYSATIAISNSVTAEVGTNWEQATNVELHKRLSKRWVITAAFTPATNEADPSKKLVLQWEKRF